MSDKDMRTTDSSDNRNKLIKFIFAIEALSLTAAYILAVYVMCGMWFETNDDVFISELLSGKVTGASEFHITYVSTLITYPLSLLYRLLPNVSWWGLLLLACISVATFTTVYYLITTCKSILQNIMAVAVTMSLLLIGIHNYGQIQYTSCAIFIAFSGYIVLLLGDGKRKETVLFFILELLACAIRDKSMLLVQPAGFAIIAVYHLVDTWKNDRNQMFAVVKRLLGYAVMVIAIAGIIVGVRQLSFATDEWKAYKTSDDVRIYLIDYDSKIEYSELSDIFAKYNISEEEYDQFLEYRIWYPDYKFSAELFDELLPVVADIRSSEESKDVVTATLTLLFTSSQFWHLHQFTLVVFVLAIVLMLVTGNNRHLFTVVAGFAGYITGLLYLALRNRYALRVMMPYYAGVAIMVSGLVLLVLCKNAEERVKKTDISLAIFAFVIAICALSLGRTQFAYIRRQNNLVNASEKMVMDDISAYCNANPDKTFVMDNSYARNISTHILETEYYKLSNYIYSGSWYGTSPTMIERGKEYINDSRYYCLVYEAQEWRGLDALEFWEHESGFHADAYDNFKISNGATIWVYEFN